MLFRSDSGEVSSGDIVIIYYTYNKYSNTELDSSIDSALSYMDVNEYNPHYKRDDSDFYPEPTDKERNLIAIVASILLKPNYSKYILSNVRVEYPRSLSKEKRISKLISRFKRSKEGITSVIKLD